MWLTPNALNSVPLISTASKIFVAFYTDYKTMVINQNKHILMVVDVIKI